MTSIARKRATDIFTTCLEIGGAAAITYGCWQIVPWLGCVVGGVLAIALSFYITRGAR